MTINIGGKFGEFFGHFPKFKQRGGYSLASLDAIRNIMRSGLGAEKVQVRIRHINNRRSFTTLKLAPAYSFNLRREHNVRYADEFLSDDSWGSHTLLKNFTGTHKGI